MQLQYYPQKKLSKEILKLFSRHLDLKRYKVFYFGSRIEGTALDRSDIDVGIEGPGSISPDRQFLLKEELERIPTLYSFDLVDFKSVSPQFKKHAKKHIEYLN